MYLESNAGGGKESKDGMGELDILGEQRRCKRPLRL